MIGLLFAGFLIFLLLVIVGVIVTYLYIPPKVNIIDLGTKNAKIGDLRISSYKTDYSREIRFAVDECKVFWGIKYWKNLEYSFFSEREAMAYIEKVKASLPVPKIVSNRYE